MKKKVQENNIFSNSLIGLDLQSLISDDYIMTNEEINNILKFFNRIYKEISETDYLYIFIEEKRLNKIEKLNVKKILKATNKQKINFGELVYCQDDLIGACREYRIDIMLLPEKKSLLDENVNTDSMTKEIAVINKQSREYYYARKQTQNIMEKSNYDNLIIDYLPEYTQVVFIGNKNNYSNTNKIQYIHDINQFTECVSNSKIEIQKRYQGILKSYEYIPKTGIISIDQEWKKYWLASKFENNHFDKTTQNWSRLDFLKYHNRFNLDKPAIKYLPLNIEITYRQLFKLADQCCVGLNEYGIKKGDTVTVCLPNTIEDYVLGLALQHLGIKLNPIHPLSTRDKIERFISQTKADYFICFNKPENEGYTPIDLNEIVAKYNIKKVIPISPIDSLNPIAKELIVKKTQIDKLIGKKLPMTYKLPSKDKILTYPEIIKKGKKYKKTIMSSINPDDIGYYFSTGGTTAKQPKIVVLPNSMANLSYYNSYGVSLKKGDSVIINYPRYIAFSDANCTHLPAGIGMRMVFTPYEYPENFSKILEKEKIVAMQVAPQFYEMILEDEKKGNFDGINLKNLKIFVAGGDKMTNSLKLRLSEFAKRHNCNDHQIIVGHGASEVFGSDIVQLFGTNHTDDERSIGIPLPIFNIKLVDDDFNEVKEQKKPSGKLLISGKKMLGYLNDEEKTSDAFYCDENQEKWYNTADIVEFDEFENDHTNVVAKFVAREKRFIMITDSDRSGKVIPDDIENEIVSQIEEVKDCCVVGIEEEEKMTLRAAIVLKDGIEETEQLKEKIMSTASKKDVLNTLTEVLVVKSLPLTDRQKVKYTEVEEMFKSRLRNQKCLVKCK